MKLSESDKKSLSQRISEIEAKTSGEIVVRIVNASDPYSGARWRVAVALSFLVFSALYFFAPKIEISTILVIQIFSLFTGHFLAAHPKILRGALSSAEIEEEVKQRAYQSFLENQLHTTKTRAGILIFLSILEKRIEILADSGAHTKAPPGYWNALVAELSKKIRSGQILDGLMEAVSGCEKLLQENFPAQKDNANELGDHVIIED